MTTLTGIKKKKKYSSFQLRKEIWNEDDIKNSKI